MRVDVDTIKKYVTKDPGSASWRTPRFFCLRLQRGDVDFLSFFCPLHEGLEAAGGNKHAFLFAGCRVHNDAFLQIRHLAAFCLYVAVAHVVPCERGFASDGADLGHRKGFENGRSVAETLEFGKVSGGHRDFSLMKARFLAVLLRRHSMGCFLLRASVPATSRWRSDSRAPPRRRRVGPRGVATHTVTRSHVLKCMHYGRSAEG